MLTRPPWYGHRHNTRYITRSGCAWASGSLLVTNMPCRYRKHCYHRPVALTIHLLLTKRTNFHQCDVRNVQKSDHIALFRHLAMSEIRPATLNWQYGERTRLWCPLVALWRQRRLTRVRFMVKSAVSLYCFTWDNILFLEFPCKSDLYSVKKKFIYVWLKIRHYRTTTINIISTPNVGYNVLCPKTNRGIFYIKHRLSLCIIYGNIHVFLYCKIWLKTLKERVIQTNVPMRLFPIQHNIWTNEFLNRERTIRMCNKWKRNVGRKKKIEASIK